MPGSSDTEEVDIFHNSFGEMLRAARCVQKISIADVASELRLSCEIIEALEAEDYSVLSAPIYVTGYLRNYARLLKIPAEPLLQAFARGNTKSPEIVSDAAIYTSKNSMVTSVFKGLLIIILVIAIGGAVAWNLSDNVALKKIFSEVMQSGQVVEEPEGITLSVEPRESVETVEQVVDRPMTKESIQVLESIDTPDVIAEPIITQPSETEPVVTEPVIVQPVVKAEPLPGNIQLVLNFRADCWTEVEDSKGKQLIFDLVPSGKQRQVTGAPPFKVFLGNATAVDIEYDGKPYDIKRHVRGNLARFQIGEAVITKSSDG